MTFISALFSVVTVLFLGSPDWSLPRWPPDSMFIPTSASSCVLTGHIFPDQHVIAAEGVKIRYSDILTI
jgi:hypothetical protein